MHNRFKILNDLLDKFKNPDNTATEGVFDQQACTQKKTTPRENRRRGRPSSQGSEEGRRAGAREAVQGSPRKADSGPVGPQRREGSGKNTSRDSRVGEEPPRLRGVRNDIRTGEVHQAHHSSRSSLDPANAFNMATIASLAACSLNHVSRYVTLFGCCNTLCFYLSFLLFLSFHAPEKIQKKLCMPQRLRYFFSFRTAPSKAGATLP